MLKQYQFQNNPVQAFVDEWCVLDPEGITTKEALYGAYSSYTRKFGYDSLSLIAFFRDLHRTLPEIKNSRIGPKDGRKYAVKGIRVKEGHNAARLI
jgi:phage/plasmid-associated DNA primase